jgi:hypothetical protein
MAALRWLRSRHISRANAELVKTLKGTLQRLQGVFPLAYTSQGLATERAFGQMLKNFPGLRILTTQVKHYGRRIVDTSNGEKEATDGYCNNRSCNDAGAGEESLGSTGSTF